MKNKKIDLGKKVQDDFERWLAFSHKLDFNYWNKIFTWTGKIAFYLEYLATYDVWVNWNRYHGGGIEWDVFDGADYHNDMDFKSYSPLKYKDAWADSIGYALNLLEEKLPNLDLDE